MGSTDKIMLKHKPTVMALHLIAAYPETTVTRDSINNSRKGNITDKLFKVVSTPDFIYSINSRELVFDMPDPGFYQIKFNAPDAIWMTYIKSIELVYADKDGSPVSIHLHNDIETVYTTNLLEMIIHYKECEEVAPDEPSYTCPGIPADWPLIYIGY